jgi:hypothetical protein
MSIKPQGRAAMRADFRAVHKLYHAWLTGLLLMVITRRGEAAGAELVFRIFRRQHLAAFLPGLKKLGIENLPHAVAAAQYHYLSNHIGGVRVEYMYESDRKAWIRYPPPRWIWHGTAICAVPSVVSAAMLRGWHGHNGVSLGNPRLGFVCTKQTVDGQDGLEGYYLEYDRELAPDERLCFSRGEEAPLFDPSAAPRLPSATWPPERLEKAWRNYAMDYIRTAIPELIDLRGPAEARHLAGETARLIGMQLVDELKRDMGIEAAGAKGFAEFFIRIAQAQGDEVTIRDCAPEGLIVRQRGWQLMRGIVPLHPVAFEVWNALWEGCLAAHDRRLSWTVLARQDGGAEAFEWRLQPRPVPLR